MEIKLTRSRQTADWGSRAGLAKVIPSSVAVGSGTGSADSLGTVTFSGVSSISLNNVFSSTYKHYLMNFSAESSANSTLRFRLRSGTTDASTTGDYLWSTIYNHNGSATVSGDISSTTYSSWQILDMYNSSTIQNTGTFYIYNPNVAVLTTLTSMRNYYNATNSYTIFSAATHKQATAYDGCTLFPVSGTMTGTVSIYGHN
jgi:hypothetical protein